MVKDHLYHLEPVFFVYTMPIHGIYHMVYVDHLHIHRIYVVHPWIYHVYVTLISTQYIHGKSMDIHGISFEVYTWNICGISMGIPEYS